MTNDEIRIAIAEACGWRVVHCSQSPARFPPPDLRSKEDDDRTTLKSKVWHLLNGDKLIDMFAHNKFFGSNQPSLTLCNFVKLLPDYPNDLNAMHEAEQAVDKEKYCSVLNNLVRSQSLEKAPFWWALIHASARQRAEAFLRTIGKWKE